MVSSKRRTIDGRRAFAHKHAAAPVVPKKLPCRCTRTRCLRLYCFCFQSETLCGPACLCSECANDGQHEEDRIQARNLATLRKFHAAAGCSCHRSGCAKKYCVCFMAQRPCAPCCQCVECKNPAKAPAPAPPPPKPPVVQKVWDNVRIRFVCGSLVDPLPDTLSTGMRDVDVAVLEAGLCGPWRSPRALDMRGMTPQELEHALQHNLGV